MPISFHCDHCGRSLNVRDELAGAEIYCPDCRAILTVPGNEIEVELDDWQESERYQSIDPAMSSLPANGSHGTETLSHHVETNERSSESVATQRPATSAPSKPRPLLLFAGLMMMGAAIAGMVAMFVAGKIRPGPVKLLVFLGVFGLATFFRGLGDRQ